MRRNALCALTLVLAVFSLPSMAATTLSLDSSSLSLGTTTTTTTTTTSTVTVEDTSVVTDEQIDDVTIRVVDEEGSDSAVVLSLPEGANENAVEHSSFGLGKANEMMSQHRVDGLAEAMSVANEHAKEAMQNAMDARDLRNAAKEVHGNSGGVHGNSADHRH